MTTMFTLEQYVTFKFMKGNRKTKKSKVNKFRRTIEQNGGILPATRDWIITINELNEIVDGQNHWQAIMNYNDKHRRNKIAAIEVIVEPGAKVDRAKEINNANSAWGETDYFDSYIELGNEDYETLRRIRNTPYGKSCGLTTVLHVCGYLEEKDAITKFRKGEFEMVREEADALDMLMRIASCKKILGEAYGPYGKAILVFARCLLIPNINKEHLVDRVSHPVVTARGFRYSTNEMSIVNNIHVLYNRELTNTKVKHLDIYNLYRDVQSRNWQHMRSARRFPSRRTDPPMPPNPTTPSNPPAGGAALRVPHGNATTQSSKRHSLRDSGVVPV